MAKEEIILEFQVEQGSALTEMEKTKKAIIGLKEEQAELNKAYKQGNITMDEYAQESVRIEQTQKKLTRTYSDMTHQIQGTKRWTDELKGSMQQLAPQVTSAISGFQGMAKAALAFIATPIGAVLAGLATALSAVYMWFKRTEEGADTLAKISSQLSAIFNVMMDRVASLGGSLAKLFTGDFIGALKSAKQAFAGVTDEIEREVQAAGELAEILDALQERELKYKIQVSETANEIKRLIIESKNRTLSEEERISKLVQAAELEKKQNEELRSIKTQALEAQIMETQAAAHGMEVQRNKDESAIEYAKRLVDNQNILKEVRDELAQKIVDYNSVEGESLILQEKMSNQLDVLREKQQAKVDEQIALQLELADFLAQQDQEDLDRQQEKFDAEFDAWSEQQDKLNERNQELKDIRLEMQQDEAEQVEELNVQVSEARKRNAMQELAITEQLVARGIERKKAELQAHKIVEANKLQLTENVLTGTMGLLKEHTIAYKAVATAKATIDTYQAASNALANAPNPIIGGIMAAIAIVMGLLNVAKINGVAMAGGGAFETKGPTWLLVGDNPGGRERVEVTPLSGKGQTRILGNGGGIAMAGGGSVNGSILATASTSPMDQQFALQDTLANQQPIYVSWTEKTQFENQMANKAQFTEA